MPIPAQITVVSVDTPLTAYRIVTCASTSDPALVECFKSNQERGVPLRANSAEAAYRMVWHGLSMYDELRRARATALGFPKLGSYVAQVELTPGQGLSYAFWGSPGHMSVWGDPAGLAGSVADIFVVETP